MLAGGESSRMGRNKAMLPFGTGRLIDHMVRILTEYGCSPVVVSGEVEGQRCIADLIPHAGPVAGIHAVLHMAIQENGPGVWFFVPVDMPLLTSALLARLASNPAAYDRNGVCSRMDPCHYYCVCMTVCSKRWNRQRWLWQRGRACLSARS